MSRPVAEACKPGVRGPHYWDCGQMRDGVVHQVCRYCGWEKDVMPYGPNRPRRGSKSQRAMMARYYYYEARRPEIVAAWVEEDRNVRRAAARLGMPEGSLYGVLKRWNLLPRRIREKREVNHVEEVQG